MSDKTDKTDALFGLISSDGETMLKVLTEIRDEPHEGESIDVRLCVDFDKNDEPTWLIRSGDVSYDQRHSALCGASSVSRDDTPSQLTDTLKDLTDQCLDQCADLESLDVVDDVNPSLDPMYLSKSFTDLKLTEE